ncbi:MAG: competence/damage-inducible protein A [Acidobacteria bacterium]|nr:MAG: competence/damage-inducible protein A [Acidobacteriota bacterium]
MNRVREPTAAIILVGNELLSGRVEDVNARFLLPELHALGIGVKRVVILPDEVDDIAKTVRECAEQFDYVFTAGGIGPTPDDLTIAGVARAFDRRVVHHEELLLLVAAHFGEPLAPEHLRFAEVPEGAGLIHSEHAPWPILHYENVYIFPGVPHILRRKFEAIRDRFQAKPFITKTIYTRQDEIDLAPMLYRVMADFPTVTIGSYPQWSQEDYRVKLVLESKDREALHRAYAALRSALDPSLIVDRD